MSYKVAGFGGVPLAVETWGKPGDPAVVLVHGLGQSRNVWNEAGRALADAGRHVMAYDLRGHGDSDRPTDDRYDLTAFVGDLRAILDHMQDRPVVVGASAGGWIAAAAVGEGGPHLASGLVLVDAAPWLDEAASERIGQLLQSHAQGFATFEDALEATRMLHPRRTAPDKASLEARLARGEDGRLHWNWDPRAVGRLKMAEVQERLLAALPRIQVPALSIRGAASEVMTSQAAEQLRAMIPGVECLEVEDAGHLVVSDQAEAFNAVLLEFLERRVPREPLVFTKGSDARTLRDALGCFPTGVTVVTSLGPDGSPIGLTANSFTSLSLDPPLLLVCIARSAGSLKTLEQAEHFAINILHIGQQPASDRFARRGEDRFALTPHESWASGVPILSGSLASFECRRHAIHEGGDHIILVGHVERAQFEPRRDPLLYFRGKYRRLHFD